MKIVAAPTRTTLAKLEWEPGAGLAGDIGDGTRRQSMLSWHLNRWVVARNGGAGDRPWLGDVSAFSGYPLAEFRRRIETLDQALDDSKSEERFSLGWEFLLTAGLWQSSRSVSSVYLVHTGFEEECRRLAEETGLPARLADSLLRSWLRRFFRCSAGSEVVLISLHEKESNFEGPGDLEARLSGAGDLTETELNAADPLPLGCWRLRKGRWDNAACGEDVEIAQSLHRLGQPPPVIETDRALSHGRDPVQRPILISPQTIRDARTIELRGMDRTAKERAKRLAEQERGKESKQPRTGYFRNLLKRIFSRKRSL